MSQRSPSQREAARATSDQRLETAAGAMPTALPRSGGEAAGEHCLAFMGLGSCFLCDASIVQRYNGTMFDCECCSIVFLPFVTF